ncbi:MAG: hypothetical protein KIT13_02130 [Burkholderiales bacterium]|nr:hypothetical protein [Burkholderiales bacterium]MCW5603203.1 hypothetical protein [Burkholderiales bacterium]
MGVLLVALCCGLPLQAGAAEGDADAKDSAKPASQPASASRVEHESFVYEAPAGWAVFNNEMRSSFAMVNFFNAGNEMIQLSVSGKLAPEQYAGARERLRKAEQGQSRKGWLLARNGDAELPQHGTVYEAVYYDNANLLTSFTYNVFGPERIALFTITLKGIRTDLDEAVRAARLMVGGLRWK